MADSAITARIGGDASGLVAALDTAKAAASKFGDDFQRVVAKKLQFRDVLKGVFQGIGIASVGAVVEKIVAPFRQAAESATALADETERGARATEEMLRMRQSDVEQLGVMENALRRIRAEAEASVAPSKEFFGFIDRGSALDKLFGFSRREDAEIVLQKEKAITKEKELSVEIIKLSEKIESDKFDKQVKNAQVMQKYVKENYELLVLEAKKVSGTLLPAERSRLEVLRLQAKEKVLIGRLEDALSVPVGQRTAKEREAIRALIAQTEEIRTQIVQKEKLLDVIKEIKGEEKEITAQIVAQKKVAFTRSGRGDADLSDRELERKRGNIKKDLAEIERGQRESGNYNGSEYFQRVELQSLAGEIAMRQKFRRNVSAFGEDRAFAMSGLTEQRASAILSDTTGEATNRKLLDGINKLNDQIKNGITVRALTAPGD